MPALTYDEGEEINAGVTGTGPHDAVLHFSGGALRKFTDREAVAVAAHELAHIAAGDFGAQVADGRLPVRWQTLSLGLWLSDIIGLISWTRRKRRREYAADRLAAALTDEEALIAALRRTARDTRRVARGWFATHPHPRRRIRALQRLRRERPRNRASPGRASLGNELLARTLS